MSMSTITDYFTKLQRENYKNPKRDNRLALAIYMALVIVFATIAARH
jgi:hypothetical protein